MSKREKQWHGPQEGMFVTKKTRRLRRRVSRKVLVQEALLCAHAEAVRRGLPGVAEQGTGEGRGGWKSARIPGPKNGSGSDS
jgi:hypothetical protein